MCMDREQYNTVIFYYFNEHDVGRSAGKLVRICRSRVIYVVGKRNKWQRGKNLQPMKAIESENREDLRSRYNNQNGR